MLTRAKHWNIVALGHLTAVDTVHDFDCTQRYFATTGQVVGLSSEVRSTYSESTALLVYTAVADTGPLVDEDILADSAAGIADSG